MKKTILFLGLTSTLSFSDMYIGVGGTIGKSDITIKDKPAKGMKGGSNYKSKDNSSGINFVLGYERDNKDRIEAKIYENKITYKNNGKNDDFTVNGIDLTYSFNIKTLNTQSFSPYFKAGLGYQKTDVTFEADYQESSSGNIYSGKYNGKIEAITLPLSIGSYYKISENIELDFGVLYRTALYQEVQLNRKTDNSKLAVLETSIDSTELFFGLNYKF